jgi:glyoxylase-like metal-dependent hydrolase (beta-lactamase superfamily II)
VIFKQISCGGDRNFGYLIACSQTKLAAVVDPSPEAGPVLREITNLKLELQYLINTHSHHNHTAGNALVIKTKAVPIVAHELNENADLKIQDNQVLCLGNLNITFLHTPGHTPDSMCLLVNNHLISGDTLFVGKVGGTYSGADAKAEFLQLQRLMRLADDVTVWPGHNYGVWPSSTILLERNHNPFCLRLHDFNEFMWLKDHWAEYKQEHNIL